MTTAEIHGVYEIRAPQPCYIVELLIHDSESELEFSNVSFDAKIPRHGIRPQAPFEERFLTLDGESVLGKGRYGFENPEVWIGEVRLVFLIHYLKPGSMLQTPFGDLPIPDFSKRPARLKQIKYVSPY